MKSLLQRLFKRFLPNPLPQELISRQIQLVLNFQFQQNFQDHPISCELHHLGFNVYSATYEDGILLLLLSLTGISTRKCVDLGAGNIYGSNTANLMVNHGFSGLLIDGSKQALKQLQAFYTSHPETSLFPPTFVHAFLTMENVNSIMVDNGVIGEIDVLSIDLDGMDYWIWKAITVINPRIVVVEYQDILGPERSWTVPYKAQFHAASYAVNRSNLNYCGASLTALMKLAKERNYRLVGCNKGGWNAFFVRNDLAPDIIPEVTVQSCCSSEWNQYGIQTRFPLVEQMEWVEV